MALEALNFGRFIFMMTTALAAIFACREKPRRVMAAMQERRASHTWEQPRMRGFLKLIVRNFIEVWIQNFRMASSTSGELCHCCQLHHALGIQFMLPVNAKKCFYCSFVKCAVFNSTKIAPHASVKAILHNIFKADVFPLVVFATSVLHKLNGNHKPARPRSP